MGKKLLRLTVDFDVHDNEEFNTFRQQITDEFLRMATKKDKGTTIESITPDQNCSSGHVVCLHFSGKPTKDQQQWIQEHH